MNDIRKYGKHFNLRAFQSKMKQSVRRVGVRGVYTIFLLYYALRQKETPFWAKNIVVGVLGYFISPIDGLPDLTAIIGYTDDLGVLSLGLVTLAAYINQDIRKKAQLNVNKYFGEVDDSEFAIVDRKL